MNYDEELHISWVDTAKVIELQRREIDRLREAVAAEREACAKACAEVGGEYDWLTARRCAEAILERGDQ